MPKAPRTAAPNLPKVPKSPAPSGPSACHSPPFQASFRARFRHADPAGILFFANVFEIAHDIYEDFVAHLGWTWEQWFQNPDWAVPIRHASCDFKRPMTASHSYHVSVFAERIGESSFTLKYIFTEPLHRNDDNNRVHPDNPDNTYNDGDGGANVCCEVSIVHAFYDKKRRSKTAIPSEIRDRLQSCQRESLATK